MFKYSQEYLEQLILDIYNGVVTVESLPVNLYSAISEMLVGALDRIEGKPSLALLTELSENLYLFSGAKTYQQINDISLLGENDLIKSFSDFKNEALQIYEQYNKNWLETEYSTTIAQAQNAVRWEQIQDQKKTLPFLKYSAVIDNNTSEICAPLDGICLPVDDPFWDSNAPSNHFNCRCLLEQFDNEDASEFGITEKEQADEISAQMNETRQELFNSNSGKSGEIFSKEHPYFNIPEKDRESALLNFGLPIPNEFE